MSIEQNLTSIKKSKHHRLQDNNFFMSPSPKNILEEQIHQLQLLNQEELLQKLKAKKQEVLQQSETIAQNCHNYFMDLTSILIQTQNRIKKSIDKQTLDFLEQIQLRTDQIRENEHSYNCNSEIYQTLKVLIRNYTETQENISQVRKVLERCYTVNLEGLSEYQSYSQTHSEMVGMSLTQNNKIYISGSQFMSTNKKIHGNQLEITERQFQLALIKLQQRQEKHMLLNERLKDKIKSLQQVLSKKGVNIKEFNKLNQNSNEKCSSDYWDLQLQRVKGQNIILKEQINNVSNKLLELTAQNQGLKSEYKKMIQSNISQLSSYHQINQNNTSFPHQNYEQMMNSIQETTSRLEIQNFIPSQTILSNNTIIKENKEEYEGQPLLSGICVQSNMLQSNIHNQILIEYEKKNEQLTIELTKRLKEIEELKQDLERQQSQRTRQKQQVQQKQIQLQKLSNHCSTLEHDYQVSSKKKFELQEKINILKDKVKELSQKQNYSIIQSNLQIENLQSLLKIKEQTIISLSEDIESKMKRQYHEKVERLEKQRLVLQQELSKTNTSISEQRKQFQQKIQRLKQEYKRLHKIVAQKEEQAGELRQKLYENNKLEEQKLEQKKEENNLSYKEKYEANKKQLTKMKKEVKEKTSEIENIKGEYHKMNELLGIRCSEITIRIEGAVKDIEKSKSMYESRLRLNEQKQKLFRQKYQHNLTQMMVQQPLSQSNNSNSAQQKKINWIQAIEKYIESMNSYCAKNAQIKKLKEENKQLKNQLSSKNINIVNRNHPNNRSSSNSKSNLTQSNTNRFTKRQLTPTTNNLNFNNNANSFSNNSPTNPDSLQKTKLLQENFSELTELQRALLQDRRKVQKGILEQKLLILEEQNKQLVYKLNHKQSQLTKLDQQLAKSKRQFNKFEESNKKQSPIELQLKSQLKSTQNKVQKLQSQLKSIKQQQKRTQQELNVSQNELKKKKQHIVNLKKQLASSVDQVGELNSLNKNQKQEIDRLKRQLKDQSTKETLLNQMKQRMEEFSQLEKTNDQLKKQIEKISATYKYETSKLNNELKETKTLNKEEINQKVNTKVNDLLQQINDLKAKNKKLKSQLERKQTLNQRAKSKYEGQVIELRSEIEQLSKQLSKKVQQCDACQKKLQILNINQRKFKEKAKLLTVVLEKVYTKILSELGSKINDTMNRNTVSNKESNVTVSLIDNTSAITRKFNSNVFGNSNNGAKSPSPVTSKQVNKDNPTLQTLAQLDINLEDLDIYSQGLEVDSYHLVPHNQKKISIAGFSVLDANICPILNQKQCCKIFSVTIFQKFLFSSFQPFDLYIVQLV